MPAPVTFEEFVIAVCATFFLPLAVLALDYFIRATLQSGSWGELIKTSGPDCCVLSLGATGAIFVDPHVSSIRGVNSPLFIIALIIFLIFMRVACIKADKPTSKSKVPSSLRYGVCSILAIFFVVCGSYLVALRR
jgi:hypothetical protein